MGLGKLTFVGKDLMLIKLNLNSAGLSFRRIHPQLSFFLPFFLLSFLPSFLPLSFSFFFLSDRVLCSSGCPKACYVARNDLELRILVSPSPTRWHYRGASPYLVYEMLGMEPRALSMLGKHSTHRITLNLLFKTNFVFILCVWCFAWLYVCTPHACPVPLENRRVTDSCQWSSGCWELNPGSFGRATCALNH